MQRAEVEQYLAEISRVLAPGGRVVATYFLLNADSHASMAAGTSSQAFSFTTDKGRVEVKHDPDAAVAFEEGYIADLYPLNGLQITKVKRGSWSGRKSEVGYQDIIVAVRR